MNLLSKIEQYVTQMLETCIESRYCFHSINHTKNVVEGVCDISKHENISEEALERLKIAAWFHDTGYTKKYNGHEEQSKLIARTFLERENYPNWKIEEVVACIEATKVPQSPKSHLQKIICDADFYHFSQNDYWLKNNLLRHEIENKLNLDFDDETWLTNNLTFLNNHSYFTDYGKKVLEKKKKQQQVKNKELIKTCNHE